MDWTEKYRPVHLTDLVGNKEAVRQIATWAQGWSVGDPPLILYGRPGIGKTSTAWALANDVGWEIIELNASDQRTKAVIERIAGNSANTGSLTGSSRKLILLDEADNLQGNADRGGARAIVEVIRQAKQPIILIANDLYGLDPAIRNICEKVQFRALQSRTIAHRLKEICSLENIACENQALQEISDISGGDFRSAVNMLYASTIGKDTLMGDDVIISRKDTRSTIFDLVAGVTSSRSSESLLSLSFSVDETPDTILQWIEGNISNLRNPHSVALAYQAISRADEYLGYTFKEQYYTLWRYATAVMLFGVHSAAETYLDRGSGYSKIMPPGRWRRMATAKKQKNARDTLIDRLGNATHIAGDSIRNVYLKPISILALENPEKFVRSFSLDADMLDLLIQDSAAAKKIIKKIEDERKKIEKELKKRQKDEQAIKKSQLKEKTPEKNSNISVAEEKSESDENESKEPASQSTLFSFG